MSIIDSLKWRYATKKFDSSKFLKEEQIEMLKEAFNLTATSFGLQPIKMIVIHNKALQEKFVEFSYNQRQVADASHLLVLCIDDDTTSNHINNYFDLEKKVRNLSEETVAGFRKDLLAMYRNMTVEERQRSAIYQAYIALGNLMTVCAIEKIDCIPMEGFIPSKIDELLDLPSKKLKSVLLMPVGYRDENDAMAKVKKVRKPQDQTIIEIY